MKLEDIRAQNDAQFDRQKAEIESYLAMSKDPRIQQELRHLIKNMERARRRRSRKPTSEEELERLRQARRDANAEGAKVAKNKGSPWNEAEDMAVMASLVPDRKLAVLLGRTYFSLQARRTLLRKRDGVVFESRKLQGDAK